MSKNILHHLASILVEEGITTKLTFPSFVSASQSWPQTWLWIGWVPKKYKNWFFRCVVLKFDGSMNWFLLQRVHSSLSPSSSTNSCWKNSWMMLRSMQNNCSIHFLLKQADNSSQMHWKCSEKIKGKLIRSWGGRIKNYFFLIWITRNNCALIYSVKIKYLQHYPNMKAFDRKALSRWTAYDTNTWAKIIWLQKYKANRGAKKNTWQNLELYLLCAQIRQKRELHHHPNPLLQGCFEWNVEVLARSSAGDLLSGQSLVEDQTVPAYHPHQNLKVRKESLGI